MLIRKDTVNKYIFGILLVFPLLVLSVEANAILISAIACFVLFNLKHKYSQTLIKIIFPLIIVLVIAIFSSFFFPSNLFDIIKDFFFILKPVLYIIIGYYFIGQIKDKNYLYKIIIYLALFFALRHLFLVISFLLDNEFNVNLVRNFSGKDNAIEIFALIILLSSAGKNLFAFNSKYRKTIIFILICSFICYFSRTVTVSVIILYLSIQGYLALSRKAFLYMFGFIISVSLFYAYLFSVNLERGTSGVEGFLYKLKIAPAEIFDSKINVKDHADLWDHWRAYEAQKAFEQARDTPIYYGLIAGKGVGSLVDLEFVAPLTEEGIQYITTLHNGYSYILFKSGVLGLLCYTLFLLLLYMQAYKKSKITKQKTINGLLSGIAVYYMFTTLIVSGLYNPREVVGIILGAFLYLQFYYSTDDNYLMQQNLN